MDEIMKLVNKQAEDKGIWFVAKTAPEAYLQNELRKLHDVIENHEKKICTTCEGVGIGCDICGEEGYI